VSLVEVPRQCLTVSPRAPQLEVARSRTHAIWTMSANNVSYRSREPFFTELKLLGAGV
jgi:hypothetical protein